MQKDEDAAYLVSRMREHKRVDLKTTLLIGGLAGVSTRDRRGNILPSVWAKQVQNMEAETGILLEANDMRKMLMKTMSDTIESNKNLVLTSDHPDVLVQWIKETTQTWELAYQDKLQEKYDISTQVYSAMQEVYFEIEPFLLENRSAQHISNIRRHIKAIHEYFRQLDRESPQEGDEEEEASHAGSTGRASSAPSPNRPAKHMANYLFDHDQALVRSIFRHHSLTSVMSRMAGKLLQKKEVLNKAGAYGTRVQRNDIVQEYNDAMMSFVEKVQSTPSLFQELSDESTKADFLFYIVDHAAIDAPVSAAAFIQESNKRLKAA